MQIGAILVLASGIPLFAAFICLTVLLVRALLKYTRSKDVREEKQVSKVSLGAAIKTNRLRCQMTQEFVAETIGVSRQAVSKWESGASDPSTSNLLALAKLFKIPASDLLNNVE